jgi:hypothetical protein
MQRLIFFSFFIFVAGCNCGYQPLKPTFAEARVEPSRLEFGPVIAGNIRTKGVTVLNVGTEVLQVESAVVTGPDARAFALEGVPEVVSLGGNITISVVFTAPLVKGDVAATLELTLSRVGPVMVPIRAQVVIPEVDGGMDGGIDGGHDGGLDVGMDAGVAPWLAFDSNRELGNRDVYVIRADGTELRRLVSGPWNEVSPAFSRDGRRLAFASDRVDFTFQIYVMELATGQVTQITDAGMSSEQPSWSADGRRIAFHRNIGVYSIAADGTDERLVIEGLNTLNAYKYPAYLPAGNYLVASRTNQIDLIRDDGTGLRPVIQNNTTIIGMPSPSPSGAQIAFAANCGGGLSVRSAPTSSLTGACAGASEVHLPGRRPAWGESLVAFETDAPNADIYVIPPQGGVAPVPVVLDPADDRNPAWVPANAMLP